MNDQNNIFGYNRPYLKTRNIEKFQLINFDECLEQFIMHPFLLREYNLFGQNTESSLEQ